MIKGITLTNEFRVQEAKPNPFPNISVDKIIGKLTHTVPANRE